MEIDLKNTLRTLRRQKNVTQENLANHLGITPQSVGKWERGEGYPDITLLPKIALYFGITVDELLNVDKARIEEKINAYKEESRLLNNKGDMKKNLELWEKAYKEFPNDFGVMVKLMYAISLDSSNYEDPMPEDKLRRITELGETVLSMSTDKDYRESVIQMLCCSYSGNDDKTALQYADMGGNFYVNQSSLRCHVLSGEEGVKASQEYLNSLIREAAMTAYGIPRKSTLSYEETVEAYTFGIDIIKRLYSDGNYGFDNYTLANNYYRLAHVHSEVQNADKTIEMLRECCKHTLEFDRVRDLDFDYTALMVNRLQQKQGDVLMTNTCNTAYIHMKLLEEKKVFDYIRDDERFQEILRKLREHAVE
ncbi:MAG: helix-turn-helix transcriptional regulator [Lachnospiraceae bacterium]|nr:helix-turn-helix transcriptional regulator [Lachnospiraceae bacterium]